MTKSFIKLAVRNLLKNKVYVFVNILGLGIAVACSIVAYLNYKYDKDFNSSHVNCRQIYNISITTKINDKTIKSCIVPISLAPEMKNNIAGIDNISRYSIQTLPLKNENHNSPSLMNEDVAFVDDGFLEMFSFPLKYGDKKALSNPNKLFLTETTARKFFGEINPVGESIMLFSNKGVGTNFIIGGVFEDIPHNSIVRFSVMANYSKYLSLYSIEEMSWRSFASGTFLQVANPELINGIESSLEKYKAIQNGNREDYKVGSFYIQSLSDFTKDSINLWNNKIGEGLHPAAIYAPIVMAALLLLLACFNFVNTVLAISGRRLKEIGVKKVIGGSRSDIMFQFLGENFIVCLLATVLALLLGLILVREYNKLLPMVNLQVNYYAIVGVWLFIVLVLIATTFFSSFYPAMYISSFKPVEILRGRAKFGSNTKISKVLLTFQFAIVIIALISGVVILQNGKFQQKLDYGYNRQQTIIVRANSNQQINALQNVLSNNPNIMETTTTNRHPVYGGIRNSVKFIDHYIAADVFESHTNVCRVLGLNLIEGKDFTDEFATSDINRSAIVNECLVREFNMDNPIGKTIELDTVRLTIVGVVQDFYEDMLYPILPAVIRMKAKSELKTLVVRSKTGDLIGLNNSIKKEWEKAVPNIVYPGKYAEDFNPMTGIVNHSLLKIYGFLSAVSVFLSIIALYTLATQTILKRRKEISVRKVVGSSSVAINVLIGKPFFLLLAFASIIGGVGAYWLNSLLLGSIFKYHTPITIISIVLPIISILLLAFLTLTSKVYQTLSLNPASSLSQE